MNKTLILVVEDDRPIRNLIITTLKTHDYKYLAAENGSSAILEASSHHPDIVLLDLGLPDMEGVEVIKKIRTWSNMPIIVISARSEDTDKIEALDAGADDYITKPFSPSELVARVKAHLARYERLIGSAVKTNDIIEIRGLKIDKTARRVYVNGEEKAFTTKEFDLLTFLAENPNHTFSKEVLFDRIWGMDAIGDVSTVTVHIQRVRDKINTENERYIETIWGVGYRFNI